MGARQELQVAIQIDLIQTNSTNSKRGDSQVRLRVPDIYNSILVFRQLSTKRYEFGHQALLRHFVTHDC